MDSTPVRSAQRVVEAIELAGVQYVFGVPGAKIDAVYDALVDGGPELVVCRHEQNAAFMAARHRPADRHTRCRAGDLRAGHHQPGHRPAHRQHRAGSAWSPCAAPWAARTGSSAPISRWTPRRCSRRSPSSPARSTIPTTPPRHRRGVPRRAHRTAGSRRGRAARRRAAGRHRRGHHPRLPIPALAGRARRMRSRAAADVIRGRETPGAPGRRSAGRHPTAARRCATSYPPPSCPLWRHSRPPASSPASSRSHYLGRVGLFRNQPGDILARRKPTSSSPSATTPSNTTRGCGTPTRPAPSSTSTPCPPRIDNHYQPAARTARQHRRHTRRAHRRAVRHDDSSRATSATSLSQRKRWPTSTPPSEAIPTYARPPGLNPVAVVLGLREHLDDDATIACDVGSVYIYMARHFRVYEPRRLLFSNGQQTLGVALPWAMAAALVRPGTHVVSVSGDGGFLFSAQELETATRLGLTFTHIIFRDNTYDMVGIPGGAEVRAQVRCATRRLRHHPLRRGFRRPRYPRELPRRVHSPRCEAALAEDGPSVIDVPRRLQPQHRSGRADCTTTSSNDA